MSIYHSTLSKQTSNSKKDEVSFLAAIPLMGYRTHLDLSWPQLKDFVEIGFIEGTNGSEIAVSCSLDWENDDWVEFFQNGIKLPKALENCTKHGIKKIILFCNNELMEFSINDLME